MKIGMSKKVKEKIEKFRKLVKSGMPIEKARERAKLPSSTYTKYYDLIWSAIDEDRVKRKRKMSGEVTSEVTKSDEYYLTADTSPPSDINIMLRRLEQFLTTIPKEMKLFALRCGDNVAVVGDLKHINLSSIPNRTLIFMIEIPEENKEEEQ